MRTHLVCFPWCSGHPLARLEPFHFPPNFLTTTSIFPFTFHANKTAKLEKGRFIRHSFNKDSMEQRQFSGRSVEDFMKWGVSPGYRSVLK